MKVPIGPFSDFAVSPHAQRQLGRLVRSRPSEADCLAAACVEIRSGGMAGLSTHVADSFEVHRCGYIVTIHSATIGVGTVLSFIEFSP